MALALVWVSALALVWVSAWEWGSRRSRPRSVRRSRGRRLRSERQPITHCRQAAPRRPAERRRHPNFGLRAISSASSNGQNSSHAITWTHSGIPRNPRQMRSSSGWTLATGAVRPSDPSVALSPPWSPIGFPPPGDVHRLVREGPIPVGAGQPPSRLFGGSLGGRLSTHRVATSNTTDGRVEHEGIVRLCRARTE